MRIIKFFVLKPLMYAFIWIVTTNFIYSDKSTLLKDPWQLVALHHVHYDFESLILWARDTGLKVYDTVAESFNELSKHKSKN